MGSQSMPVGDEEEAFVFMLQLQPILEHSMIVAEVQPAGGSHTGDDAVAMGGSSVQWSKSYESIIRGQDAGVKVSGRVDLLGRSTRRTLK